MKEEDEAQTEVLDIILKWMKDVDPFGKIVIEKGEDGKVKRFTIHEEKTKKFTYRLDRENNKVYTDTTTK